MDEMTRLRDMRADAPTPDRARLAAGRAALLDAAGARRPARGLAGGRLPVIGAAAAMVVAALTTAQLTGGEVDVSVRPAATRSTQPSAHEEAVAVLRKAARAAADRPVPPPRTGQWIYVKTVEGNLDAPGGQAPPAPDSDESWHEFGALRPDWKTDDHFPYREQCAVFEALPAEPDRVFDEALDLLPDGVARGEDEGADAYRAAQFLLQTPAPPPHGLAKVYRALAEVEGMRVVDHLVEDATGERAIALYYDGGAETREEILLDARTYRYVGTRAIRLTDQEVAGNHDLPLFEAGDVVSNEAVTDVAVVDREGERP